MDLGLERAGMECRWQVEIDPFCNKVLEKHWPGVKRYGDIREVGAELERVDLIAGGFPCQDVSQAGAKAGINGDRTGLYKEFLRLADTLGPRVILMENVAGLLVGRGIGVVLGDLASLGMDAEWGVHSACSIGTPHPRARVFIVAYPNSLRLEGTRLSGAHGETMDRPPLRSSEAPTDEICGDHWGSCDPRTLGVAHGFSSRVDWKGRIKGLGNAVVPQVAEWLGKRIIEAFA